MADFLQVTSFDPLLVTSTPARGITSIAINGSNHLIITYTDGTTADAGLVGSSTGTVKSVDGVSPDGAGNVSITAASLAAVSQLVPTSTKTGSYTASVNDLVIYDVSSGAGALTLPTTPADRSRIGAKVVAGTMSGGALTNNLTINAGGAARFNTTSGSTTLTVSTLRQGFLLQYQASNNIWIVIEDSLDLGQIDTRYVSVANAAPLSNLTPQALGTASPGTAAEASRADHVHQTVTVAGANWMYADGSDGNLVFDGTSSVTGFSRSGTTYNRSGGAAIYANNVTINAGVTVKTFGSLLFVAGTLTLGSGAVLCSSVADASSASGASVGFFGSPQTGMGGDGGAGHTTAGSSGAGAQASGISSAAGGAGGAGSGNAGGSVTAASWNGNNARHNVLRVPQTALTGNTGWIVGSAVLGGGTGGGGGGGDGTNSGGGGGAGGCSLVVNAKVVVNNGRITARGGNGAAGQGGNTGGGGGGGGGFLWINTTSYTGSGTYDAAGGTGGAGAGTGTAGSTGTAGTAILTVFT